ncbi:MAG: hypothetical protein ACE5ES_04500 [Candidatus Nanoarchaeia archaeon]
MNKKMKKGAKKDKLISVIIFLGVIILLIIPLISAGFFDWIEKTITGKLTSRDTNVSVTVSGDNQVIVEDIEVQASNYNPVEGTVNPITVYVIVSDVDGVNDINDSSVKVNFTSTATGEATRLNNTCLNISDIDSTTANFSCSVDVYYYDANSLWTVMASANDLGNLTPAHNTSADNNFTLNLLKAMVIDPISLTWTSISAGSTNQKSNNDPTTINNTGNYNSTIQLTAIDLAGESISTEFIYAANFTGGIEDECDTTGVNATFLINGTAVTINNSFANKGNLSAGGGAGQEQFYYCIPTVSSVLSSQIYSTTDLGPWVIAYP